MTVVSAAAPARGQQTPELADLSFETRRSEATPQGGPAQGPRCASHKASVLSEAFGESFIDTVRGIAPTIVGRTEGKEGWRP